MVRRLSHTGVSLEEWGPSSEAQQRPHMLLLEPRAFPA
jgi:hypothetical protein